MKVSQAPSTDLTASALTFFTDATSTDSRVVGSVVPIKNKGGQIYLLDLMNGAAATSYLQVFFRPASQVTLGATVADLVIKLPTNAGSGFVKTVAFGVPVGGQLLGGGAGTGLCMAGTTSATNSTTAAIGVTVSYL